MFGRETIWKRDVAVLLSTFETFTMFPIFLRF